MKQKGKNEKKKKIETTTCKILMDSAVLGIYLVSGLPTGTSQLVVQVHILCKACGRHVYSVHTSMTGKVRSMHRAVSAYPRGTPFKLLAWVVIVFGSCPP